MNERIRKLRRYLDLTQKEFGERIGVKGNTVATYEGGRNEPIDSVVSLICKEFNVNEMWLRTGEGEMFVPTPVSALDELVTEQNLSNGERILVEKFLALKPEARRVILDYIVEVAAAIRSGEVSSPAAPDLDAAERDRLHAELDRQLDLEKEAAAKSEAS